jgi:hypothetical protein
VAAHRQVAQPAHVDGELPIVVLHELGEVEQQLQHLRRHALRRERRLERLDEGLAVLCAQL